MILKSIIDSTLIPLKTSETGEEALSIMSEYNLNHLPIVNNEQLLGTISEDDILQFDIKEPIGSYRLSIPKAHVKISDHIYDAFSIMGKYQLTVIPVVDNSQEYLGLITQKALIEFFAKTASFVEKGSIITLEINRRDYSLSEVCRIIESEGGFVLNAYITSNSAASVIELTIKLDSFNTRNILATFERFKYKISGTFQEEEYFDTLKDRYDSLLHYLDI